jgi:hypothetical protein
MGWVEYVAHIKEMRNTYKFLSKNFMGKDHLQDLGVHEMIILK